VGRVPRGARCGSASDGAGGGPGRRARADGSGRRDRGAAAGGERRAGTLAFGTGSPTAVKRGEGAPFQPLVYALDLLIPIGGLGQRTAWYWTHDGLQWLAYLLIAFGWVLTTAVVAGVTRTLQKN
jgi:hypothetical protein